MLKKTAIYLLSSTCIFLAFSELSYAEDTKKSHEKTALFTNSGLEKSNNPLMFLTEEEMDITPLVAPSISEYIVETNEIITYNAETQEELITSNHHQELETDIVNIIKPFEGLLPSISLARKVLGSDERVRISNTTAYPWRTITKLNITFPDGKTGGCSGAIISNFHVLTAGHCVYSRGHGGYAKIKVYPGQNGSYTPYYFANSTKIRTYSLWTINRDPNHDWALITLDRNMGLLTGWMGLKATSRFSTTYKNNLNLTGYPKDRLKGTQWNDFKNGHSTTEYRHFYFMDSYGEQSGSPVWRFDGSKRYILSIHAYGDSSRTPGITNGGTRINNEKYNKIHYWRSLDKAPTDKPDLIDDGNAYSGFSSTTVSSGEALSAHSDIRNIGTAKSGGFYVSYYASKDSIITTSDYYLGKVWVASISPFSKADANWTGTLPKGIPAGSYSVGWIIDSTHLNDEFNEKNNSAYKSTQKLTVSQNGFPILISPIGTIIDDTPSYKWKAIPNATYYYIWANDSTGNKVHRWYSASKAGCRRGTGVCSITPTTRLANGNSNWMIRGWINKKLGPWSHIKTFKVTKAGALTSPSGTIFDNTPTYSWKAIPKATYYNLWVNDSTGKKIRHWYSAVQTACPDGTGTCSITPKTRLADGDGEWKIQSWSPSGYGAWSPIKKFNALKDNNTGALISPKGTITNSMPTYTWKAESAATYYYIWVKDSKGYKLRRWYKATSLGCQSGKGTCSVTPRRRLANGKVSWKIRAWGSNGYGSWSKSTNFYKK